MAATKPHSPPITQRQVLWLAAAALAVGLPLTPYLPLWLSGLAGLALIGRGWLLWRRIPPPPHWMLNLVAVAALIGVGLEYRTIIGKNPGIALLTLFLALKLFEMRSRRDAYVALLLALFLILAHFLHSQSIAAAIAALAALLVTTGAMIALNHDQPSPRRTLAQAGKLLLQATPFMVLLFILFPRLSTPLWGLPADAHGGLSGLSESMAPGSITELSLSDAIAFRARFSGPPPPKAERYWRGPVLEYFDGRTWHIGPPGIGDGLPYRPEGPAIDYEVTLEPHNRHWLFALDLPGQVPSQGYITHQYQLLSKEPIHNRLRYPMRSHLALAVGKDETEAVRRAALRLPTGFNPRSRALAEALRGAAKDDRALVNAMLARYRTESFVYTLAPPALGRHSIDEFLFETRRGFCEHFAASFVFVMRAAGIPARVVTGYQGGEINPVDGFLLVRQSDAHAWAEVWLKGEGWRRVDPTAAIAPDRVQNSLAAAVQSGDPLPLLERPTLAWLRQLRYRWEALSNHWNQWVLGYDDQRQQELLRRLGMAAPDWRTMGILLAVLCGALMLLLAAWTLRQWRRADPLQAAWRRFQRKLRPRGLERRPWEGPCDHGRRLCGAMPGKAGEIEAICGLYESLRYGKVADSRSALSDLKRRIAEFSP
ncbi:hypothetical protein B9N43_00175 [Denitratisoma sp. DHT3]|uniref:transglutaminase TgpA family protein n=1 Tax=Denitratisoma sp. DHT3 TaxID=1981880 RepID=UPI001198B3AD|nr:DUF3488 and transglutaminase-like domain-containing protein [Denitratisoma sp. DHT3]QDX79821.1 hypothetical protein B9N43_00175 [Denitratisoma sp. DHT3]